MDTTFDFDSDADRGVYGTEWYQRIWELKLANWKENAARFGWCHSDAKFITADSSELNKSCRLQ